MASNYTKKTYNVDLVFCIDATASMTHLIKMVKQNAINFQKDLQIAMEAEKKSITQLRIRLIAFRDFLADNKDGKNDAILATDFFSLPQDNDLFVRSVNSIEAFGGGDDPEDGLEALAYAIRSKWTPASKDPGIRTRQVIVIWTDTGTHELGFGSRAPGYPAAMPKTFTELSAWWPNMPDQPGALMDYSSSRLVIFAPEEPFWTTIYENWENVVQFSSEAGNGLQEIEYHEIFDTLVGSIASQGPRQTQQ